MNKEINGLTAFFGILAALLPILGFILGIIYISKNSEEDRRTGTITLIISIVAFLFWLIVFMSGSNTTYGY